MAAEPLELARLQYPEKLHARERQVTDLVQEQGSAVSGLKRPTRIFAAPVKAPASAPKSSLSISVSGRAPALTLTKGFDARRELTCMISAIFSSPNHSVR